MTRFDEGTYQGGTNHEVKAVHVYDDKNNIIAVFDRSPGNCITISKESAELKATGNFGGREDWVSGQVKNLPPVTPVNSFESDVILSIIHKLITHKTNIY